MRVFVFLAVSALGFAQGSSYRWLKEVGGSSSDVAIGMAMDRDGNTYIAGTTISLDFPVVNALQPLSGGTALYRVDAGTTAAVPLRSAAILSVSAVAIDPRDPRVFYALTNSKLLRSRDSGATWTSFTAPQNLNSAYSIDVAPDGTVYITADDVIYQSVDLSTWKPISAGVTKGRIYAVIVDPGNPSRLFARTSDGVAWTENAGATWTQTGVYVYDVSFDPFSPGTMYAGGMGALVSHDSGKTWTNLGDFPVRDVFPQTVLRDPLHPDSLYAASYNGLFVSTDSGQTWQASTHQVAYPIVVDRTTGSIYANSGARILMTRDGFNTITPLGPPANTSVSSFRASGGALLVGTFASADVFVTKLDPDGNVVYSTYVGGSANDSATAMTVDGAGAVYVAGTTSSSDFPFTTGAYTNQGNAFLFKLNPDGTLAYSTRFSTSPNAVAVDSSGSAYLGGSVQGGLYTTPGAYQPEFNGTIIFCGVGTIFCPPNFATNAFVTKFSPNGSALVYSTYVGKQMDTGTALAIAPDGSAYVGGQQHFFKLSADGSHLLATVVPTFQPVQFVTDASGNLYAAGHADRTQPQAGVIHSFINSVAAPSLPGGYGYSGPAAIVAKFGPDLTQIAAALLGGEKSDSASSVSIDSSGGVLLAGSTSSRMFPTRAPVQSLFAAQSGFVAQLGPDLATLSFASYEGDTRPFSILNAVTAKDGSLVFGGSTLPYFSGPFDGPYQPPTGPSQPPHVFVAKLAVQVPSPRLDSVANAASFASVPLTANEAIILTGDGFGPDPQVLVDGQPISVLSASAKSITAVVPEDYKSTGASQVAVSSAAGLTNPILIAGKPGAPGIFSADGSGIGQGYILNPDGTPNSPSNPAPMGSVITIFATGPGPITMAGPFAVTQVVPAIFIDGFYANGVDARIGPVAGLPGNVYQLRVIIPDPSQFANINPNLAGFKMPPLVSVQMLIGDVYGQQGIALSVK